jgi:hypothetical protein
MLGPPIRATKTSLPALGPRFHALHFYFLCFPFKLARIHPASSVMYVRMLCLPLFLLSSPALRMTDRTKGENGPDQTRPDQTRPDQPHSLPRPGGGGHAESPRGVTRFSNTIVSNLLDMQSPFKTAGFLQSYWKSTLMLSP